MGEMTGEKNDPAVEEYPPNSIHLVRTAQQLTMTLSQMADQKASILMGATFVVFTVSIGQASRTAMPISLGILAFFAFVSAVLAVTAVLPRVSPRGAKPNPNILFFGTFSEMGEQEFIDAVKSQMRNDDDILATMLRDIHQNGSMLARRKYHFLALAYRTFIVGLTLTLLSFLYELSRSWL
ncbi:MAG: Pycsar system effector family protein [Sphingopyxis sp.]